MKGAPAAGPDDESTTVLGDWFVNALFWKPQGVPEETIAAERSAMSEVRLAPPTTAPCWA